jgi:hypothetical protein
VTTERHPALSSLPSQEYDGNGAVRHGDAAWSIAPPHHERVIAALGDVRFKERGLELSPGLTFTEWQAVGEVVGRVEANVRWCLGDWWRFGEHRYGESAAQALPTGYKLQTVKNVASVAGRFELSRRRDDVSFSHHEAVAALPPEQADALLETAAKKRWSEKDLRAEVRRYLAEQRVVASVSEAVITLARWEDWLPHQPQCDLLLADPPFSTEVPDIEAFANEWLPQALAKVKPSGRAFVFVGAYAEELGAYLAVSPPPWLVRDKKLGGWTYRTTMGPKPGQSYNLNWQAVLHYRGVDAEPLDCPALVEGFAMQDIAAPGGPNEPRWHRWQKPDLLAERFVRHATKPGDLVLVPFAGTGTTLLAAARLGRRARGCESDTGMFAIALERGCQAAT